MRILASLLLLVAACPTNKPAPPPSEPASQPAAAAEYPLHRGAAFELSEETALAAILAAPAEFAGRKLRTRGAVERVCAKKGCWMELRAEGPIGVRVTFKDYAFFVPTDASGTRALVEGEVSLKTLEASHAKHLEEEGARVTRNAAGEAVEVAFVAHAVELER